MGNFNNAPSVRQAANLASNARANAVAEPGVLYHYQNYATAGQTQLTFFQTTSGAAAGGLEDTNMSVAGMLPAPQMFVVGSIEVHYFSAEPVSKATGAAAAMLGVNDTYNVLKSGYLRFNVLSRDILTEAPLIRFPPSCYFDGAFALADVTTAGANLQTRVGFLTNKGAVRKMQPPLTLLASQNFQVTLNWNTAVALTSGSAGRIGVVLRGLLYRDAT